MPDEGDAIKVAVLIGIVLVGYFALDTLKSYAAIIMTNGVTAGIVGLLILGGVLAYKKFTS